VGAGIITPDRAVSACHTCASRRRAGASRHNLPELHPPAAPIAFQSGSTDRKAMRASMRPYFGKRAVDLITAGTACAVFAPLAAGIALATWFEDGGPPLFLQTRVGHQRRPFTVFKFRTMRDQQVTRVGRWLRQTGLDELPQFINVCRGEMSVIGPRPLTTQDIQRLGWTDQNHDWRFAARPGITGLSQLLAGRSARYSRRLERLYLRRQSLPFDLRLIALTFAVSLVGKRLVRRWLRQTTGTSRHEGRGIRHAPPIAALQR
jgi:undecaprenyl phosphate N,N'-diacetylbacillosamine 1-phosphate transferase